MLSFFSIIKMLNIPHFLHACVILLYIPGCVHNYNIELALNWVFLLEDLKKNWNILDLFVCVRLIHIFRCFHIHLNFQDMTNYWYDVYSSEIRCFDRPITWLSRSVRLRAIENFIMGNYKRKYCILFSYNITGGHFLQ